MKIQATDISVLNVRAIVVFLIFDVLQLTFDFYWYAGQKKTNLNWKLSFETNQFTKTGFQQVKVKTYRTTSQKDDIVYQSTSGSWLPKREIDIEKSSDTRNRL